MDQKRTKFSPSTINDLEQAVVNQLVGLREGNRYSVPEEYRGRAQTTWDSLVKAFPAPASISCHLFVNASMQSGQCTTVFFHLHLIVYATNAW